MEFNDLLLQANRVLWEKWVYNGVLRIFNNQMWDRNCLFYIKQVHQYCKFVVGCPERKMNQLELGIQFAGHITCHFSEGKALYITSWRQKSLSSESKLTPEGWASWPAPPPLRAVQGWKGTEVG